MTDPLITICDVHKSFDDVPVLLGIDLHVEKGELIALVGRSGCGKSTLLRCLNGLETLDHGRITIDGIALERTSEVNFSERAHVMRERVGMVFQSFNLFPHLTVLENLTKAPMVVQKKSRAEAETIAHHLLAKVGLGELGDRYPFQLSGGQQQRAAIARALAMNPKVMLYDEPTSALDPDLVDEVLQVMKQLDSEGMTQLVVTHEMRFAKDAADRIAFLEQGRVVEIAAPQTMFSNPKDERTRQYFKRYL